MSIFRSARGKAATIALGIVGCIAVAGMAIGLGPLANHRAADASGSGVAAQGADVADGQFTFSAQSIECGYTKFAGHEAAGQFCVLPVTVTNSGDVGQPFNDSAQFLLDADGRRYSPSDRTMWDANPDASTDNINPGLSVDWTLVWDVPATMRPVAVEFHDSVLSGGVRQSLS